MIRYALAISFLLVWAFDSQAQSQNPPTHQHAQVAVTTIDGRAHPELIPDSTAYRLFLLSISELPNASQEDRNRQDAHVGKLNLSARDRLTLYTILAEFKSQYLTLVDRYNQSAEAASKTGLQPDEKTFLQERDDLVQSTRDTIRRLLTADEMANFDARVQGEKKYMRIHVSGGQQ